MSSSEETVDESGTPPLPSAQPRENDQYDHEGRLSSSGEELLETVLGSDRSNQLSHRTDELVSESPTSSAGNQSKHSPQPANAAPKQRSKARPNKYHGPASTWRDWTASERQLAASLDQLQAKDLSIHLYNTFWLKRRIAEEKQQRAERHHEASASARQHDKDWQPPMDWAAWPLAPDQVPRESENYKWEDETNREPNVLRAIQRPTEVLQDLLVARVLKKAKERILKREWEDPDHEIPAPPVDLWAKGQKKVSELAGDLNDPQGAEPVLMADDQRAKDILQPSINHALGKLDALLMGLHHARSSYATYNKASESIHALTDEDVPRKYKQRKATSRAGPSDPSDQHADTSRERSVEESPTDAKSSARQRRYRKVRQRGTSTRSKAGLGLRDWSDVLGVASMSGWDPAVVTRAAARCSNLFEEGMTFRTLHEGLVDDNEVTYLPSTLTREDLQPEESVTEESQPDTAPLKAKVGPVGPAHARSSKLADQFEDEMHGSVHVDGFLQPIQRHQSWGLRDRSRRKT
ncbi:MAG: hypothetical protein Q9218_007637 [Villophora microphyllina]